ncbi:MAG: hypothetical protein AB8B91_20040 [Rubripirellula sp.]
MPDREFIESALKRVQSGELSLEEATRTLLATQPTTSRIAETLDSLIDRLGHPPSDITEVWCEQATQVTIKYLNRSGQSLPPFELDEWLLDATGNLSWRDVTYESDRETRFTPTAESQFYVEQFRRSLHPELDVANAGELATDSPKRQTQTDSLPEHPEPAANARLGPRGRQALLAAGVLACAATGGMILYNASSVSEVSQTPEPATPPPSTSIFSPETISGSDFATESNAPTASELETLETIESMTEAEFAELESNVQADSTFSLDDLMPATASFVPPRQPMTNIDAANDNDLSMNSSELAAGETKPASEMSANDSVDAALDDDTSAPDESPQQTRTSKTMAIRLPDIETTDATLLTNAKPSSLRLEFPFEVPLELVGQTPWEIRDTRKNILVASIASAAEGIDLAWSKDAAGSASVSALAHGRVETDSGKIYLRPSIEAAPWPIRLDQPDVMPTWNLAHAIPPRVTNLTIDFQLPEEIELGWIEPIEPGSLRRTRGLAVLTPKDSESISLGIRFDIRCSRKLTVRVRFAARLDPSMPWQIVSNSMLDQLANQLTAQASLVSAEATRLERVASTAGSTGRRYLRIKQDRNDDRGEMVRTTSLRVAQLQSMIAGLEAEGAVEMKVWVQWPDSQQVLLSTASTPEPSP